MATVILERPGSAAALRKAMDSSEFLRSIAAVRVASGQTRVLRALTAAEIETLTAQHNAAEDWSRVQVSPGFNPHKVVGSYFSGDVELGAFQKKVALEPGVFVGSGVYNCDLCNVTVGDDAHLANNGLIANVQVGAGAIVRGCGSVACTGETAFGNGQQVSLGLEVPGRETGLFAEITVSIAARIAGRRDNAEELASYARMIGEYRGRASSSIAIIEPHAVIKNTPKILNVYIGAHAVIDSATWIENSTVLSSRDEPARIASGACVKDSIVQWGCRVEKHAIVESSVLCEHSFAEAHGSVVRSLIAPNSGVAGGECINSLVGPFVGFNHQALLVAAYWPEGKGNIGYGANVGANHTSKAPDQEIWPGEGLFFGLGCNIKFPADFSSAPYSIIAAGVATLPQKVEMPFSLINTRAEMIDGISPAYNEILPGWVLSDNIYLVRRNERKFATRNLSRREPLDHEVFRPEIVDRMVRARAALKKLETSLNPARAKAIKIGEHSAVFTDKDLPGLGKNFMKETARLEGIGAYTFYIRLYALKGLYFAVRFCMEHGRDVRRVLEPGTLEDPRYEHELALLKSEFAGKSVRELLEALASAHEKMAADTLLTKEKDNFRGVRIIPDYARVHVSAKDDPFIKSTLQETEELKQAIAKIVEKLG